MIPDAVLRRHLPDATVRLAGDAIRATTALIVLLGWVWAVAVHVRLAGLMVLEPDRTDFTIFYGTAMLLRDGLPLYGPLPPTYGLPWGQSHLHNLNPPHVILLLGFLAWLPYGVAAVTWLLLGWASVGVALVVVTRELQIQWTRTRLLVTGPLVLGSVGFVSAAVYGEMSLVLVLPFTLAWREIRRRRWGHAGAWLGVCSGAKLFFLLFVLCAAAARKWRASAAALAVLAACYGFGVAVVGPDVYAQWIEAMDDIFWWGNAANASILGVVVRTLSPIEAGPPTDAVWAVARPLGSALAGGVGVGTVLAFPRVAKHGADAGLLLALTGALLASPLGWTYYLPLALAPAIGIVHSGFTSRGRAGSRLLVAGLVLLYVPLQATRLATSPWWLAATAGSLYCWSLTLLWLALIAEARTSADRTGIPALESR